MSERNYYVICEDGCEFPAMTKEQIIAAIAEATGNTPTGIDDAFITKLKEMNSDENFSFWIGTTAQYNALTSDQIVRNRLYILTDDDTLDSIDGEISELESDIASLSQFLSTVSTKLNGIYDGAKTLTPEDKATQDFTDVEYSMDGYWIHEPVAGGLYAVRVYFSQGGQTQIGLMFEFDGLTTMYSCPFYYEDAKSGVTMAFIKAEPDGTGKAILRVVGQPTSSSSEDAQFTISVRKIGGEYDNTITFKIGNTVCTAVRGMTWYEYANSDYPSEVGITLTCAAESNIVKYGNDGTTYVAFDGVYEYGSDEIINGTNYNTVSG